MQSLDTDGGGVGGGGVGVDGGVRPPPTVGGVGLSGEAAPGRVGRVGRRRVADDSVDVVTIEPVSNEESVGTGFDDSKSEAVGISGSVVRV
jgi:hypothetical protein